MLRISRSEEESTMRAAVVAGSRSYEGLDLEALAGADLLVAADGGAEALAYAGMVPTVLIGDMDSVTDQTRQACEDRGIEVVRLCTNKNETDTEAALRLVVDRGADEITIHGALGGPRLDHLLGNILLLSASWLDNVAVRMVDDRHEVFLVRGDVVFGGEPGDLVSLLPLTTEVKKVRTSGLSYPLAGESLFMSSTRSISNSMTGHEARVAHREGILLVVHYRGRQ
jgi:thiamine pyrophosphokinase